eukprot:CAMPEP_0184867834 /NCGR_PEP_ID=MMETSP0580-20130426/27897_1 /TAXON_ID=1118495 /ORGANISM="Dactyliosolen fragilissimus" /LENGTH=162 /DNA_ID=CAMNT_0027368305 /DNA_START=354 /DNA_END=842 /DNA_ORIENTATION=-
MNSFSKGEIDSSISYFDRADESSIPNGSLTPYLWQRGISYYYADRFFEGSQQFRYDVKVNPLDVEEIVWDIACLSRWNLVGTTNVQNSIFSQQQNNSSSSSSSSLINPNLSPPNVQNMKMSLPPGKSDRRKIMGTVYSLFRGDGATELDLAQAGHQGRQVAH